jgi:2,4-dienoyl-CoA reductase-like NADH-dependent reductase (Old Yellow Enzyme family)
VYESLFKPIDIAGVRIPNRLARTAHQVLLPRLEEWIAYHVARARGGLGLNILEASGVHPSCVFGLPCHDDKVIDDYRQLAEAMEPWGTKTFQQLWHGGNTGTGSNSLGSQLWSASDIPGYLAPSVPMPMSTSMIEDVVAAFADAARRVQLGGLDGVEVHAGHGYLLAQFLSPTTNIRDDDYGGELNNRMRFLREVIAAVRSAVGPDFPIGVRLSADEQVPGGLTPDDTAQIAHAIESEVDYINISLSSYYRLHRILTTMEEPLGYELPMADVVARAVSKATLVNGRIMTLEHANRIVENKQADLVSMVRALIADPDLIRKSREGRESEVRPCIGSAQGCTNKTRLGCVVNVAAGAEIALRTDIPTKQSVQRKVMIAGGGPAGLEAARTAALLGDKVVLYELTRHLGGQVNIAASAPHRGDMRAVTSWLAEECSRLGVVMHLASAVDPDVVADESPDVLVVATGSSPRRDGFQTGRPRNRINGFGLTHVYTSWDVFGFGGRAAVGKEALVFDDVGTYEAISVAETLMDSGAKVTMLSRFGDVGSRVQGSSTSVALAKERLDNGPFRFFARTLPLEITPTEVLCSVLGGPKQFTIRADTVVLTSPNKPNRDLADALEDFAGEVLVVGDAAGTVHLQNAIHGAHLAVRGDA